jgi:hypothetical protein
MTIAELTIMSLLLFERCYKYFFNRVKTSKCMNGCCEMQMHSKDSVKRATHDADDIQPDAEIPDTPTMTSFKYTVSEHV